MKKTLSFLTILILLVLGAYFILTNYLGFNIGNIVKVEQIELSIYAPRSLESALNELKTSYESENPSTKLNITCESSSEIVENILAGTKPDLAIVASQRDLKSLSDKKLVASGTEEVLAKNTLVIIASPDSTIDNADDLSDSSVDRIAVGDPDTTSVGHYTTTILKNMNLYNKLEDKLNEQNSVSALLHEVEDGKAEAGIVFKSDAASDDRVKIVYEFPQSMYTPITYTMFEVPTNNDKENANVKLLEEYLLSATAQQKLVDYGFTNVSSTSSKKDDSSSGTKQSAN